MGEENNVKNILGKTSLGSKKGPQEMKNMFLIICPGSFLAPMSLQ